MEMPGESGEEEPVGFNSGQLRQMKPKESGLAGIGHSKSVPMFTTLNSLVKMAFKSKHISLQLHHHFPQEIYSYYEGKSIPNISHCCDKALSGNNPQTTLFWRIPLHPTSHYQYSTSNSFSPFLSSLFFFFFFFIILFSFYPSLLLLIGIIR